MFRTLRFIQTSSTRIVYVLSETIRSRSVVPRSAARPPSRLRVSFAKFFATSSPGKTVVPARGRKKGVNAGGEGSRRAFAVRYRRATLDRALRLIFRGPFPRRSASPQTRVAYSTLIAEKRRWFAYTTHRTRRIVCTTYYYKKRVIVINTAGIPLRPSALGIFPDMISSR